MVKKVLVAIPYKSTLNPVLRARMNVLSTRLSVNNPGYIVELCRFENDTKCTPGDPFSAHAEARNKLIDQHLTDHDLVMWIDADLVDYPTNLITLLDNGCVSAPVVLIEGTKTFYDTYGYREYGREVSAYQPYFNSSENLVDLDAVGCAYLIPASVYKENRYHTTPGHTEHYSIMQAARRNGLRIVCDTRITVYHADLPKYGESWHGH